ncbi:MAG: metallophosphoesterase family protein [Bryobacterales bacterium]|nr:metallophosphoesterase family protein [Bryobacterales bacterium]
MRYLIISDLHANWHALQAVLNAASGDWDSIVCCGDIVGYGAAPNEVVDWVRANVRTIVRGNHDRTAVDIENMEWFNAAARDAMKWTAGELSAGNLEYLRLLPKGPICENGFEVLHGSPVDEDEYLTNPREIGMMIPYLDRSLAFFGHTHLQGTFESRRTVTREISKPAGAETEVIVDLDDSAWYMVNPGSAGQPRDFDRRAAYALLSTESRQVRMLRVEYDIAGAQAAIRRAGLPEPLAVRLGLGR